MQARVALDRVPRRNPRRRRALDRLREHAPVEVLASGQPKERKRRRRHIKDRRRRDLGAALNARPRHHQHALRPVPARFELHAPLGRQFRQIGAQVVAVETMIGQQDHRRPLARGLEQPPERRVVPLVHAVHHAAEEPLLALGDMRHLRRDELHEVMPDGVDRVEEDHRSVPRAIGTQRRNRGRLDRRRVRHQLDERLDSRVTKTDLVDLWQQLAQHLARKRACALARRSHRLRERGRVHRARHKRPRCVLERGLALLQEIRHHAPANRLGRVRRIPAHHARLEPVLRQDVPESLRLAARRGRDPQPPALRLRLDEVQNPMLVRGLSRCDRTPKERRQLRLERPQIGAAAGIDQSPQHGHLPRRKQPIDDQPVCCIPTDNEQALRDACWHLLMLADAKTTAWAPRLGRPRDACRLASSETWEARVRRFSDGDDGQRCPRGRRAPARPAREPRSPTHQRRRTRGRAACGWRRWRRPAWRRSRS